MIHKVNHRAGCISANTIPRQLCWGDWEMVLLSHAQNAVALSIRQVEALQHLFVHVSPTSPVQYLDCLPLTCNTIAHQNINYRLHSHWSNCPTISPKIYQPSFTEMVFQRVRSYSQSTIHGGDFEAQKTPP